MKNDLIRRSDAILYSFYATFNNGLEPYDLEVVTVGYINSIPAVDAVEVRHGEWHEYDDDYGKLCCSVCEGDAPGDIRWDYCPHCGAIMDGRREDGDNT